MKIKSLNQNSGLYFVYKFIGRILPAVYRSTVYTHLQAQGNFLLIREMKKKKHSDHGLS